MREFARMGYTLVGLAALAAPAAARAGMPVQAGAPWSPAQNPKAARPGLLRSTAAKAGQAAERLCADCKRVKVMAAEGVNIPPPPPLPPGTVVRGESCTRCGRPAAVHAGNMSTRSFSAPMMARGGYGSEPGRAVVGGEPAFAANGVDPLPIGAAQPRFASAAPMPPAAGGPRDPSVMPTSVASDPVQPPGSNRPHVVSHLLGLSGIGRDRAQARARRKEETHAMIPYGPQGRQTVADLPASVVYGR